MVMRYPNATAASKALPKGRPGSPRPYPQRPMTITPRSIPGVTLPKPPIPKGVGLKLLGRGLARAVPFLGTLLLAKDALELYNVSKVIMGGWTLTRACTSGFPPWIYRTNVTGSDFYCGYGYTKLGTDPSNLSTPVPAGVNDITMFDKGEPYIGSYRWARIGNSYHRSVDTSPELAPHVGTGPQAFPVGLPFATPAGLPLSPLTGTPRPKPWGEAMPGVGEQPSADPETEPAPQSKPIWEIPPLRFPVVLVPGVTPGMPPEVLPPPSPNVQEVVIPSPGTGTVQNPRVQSRPATNHERKNRPPRKHEKEKKIHVRTVAGGAWAIINMFTEGLDFLDVVWEALPKKDRTKGRPTPYDKARDIYDHFDQIDIAKAIENYINNQIEDYVYGMIGKQVAKAQGVIGSPTGLSRSLSKTRGQFLEEMDAEIQLPEIHYDPMTGEIYLTGFGLSSR